MDLVDLFHQIQDFEPDEIKIATIESMQTESARIRDGCLAVFQLAIESSNHLASNSPPVERQMYPLAPNLPLAQNLRLTL